MKDELQKRIFFWAAIWNFAFSISGLLMPKLTLWLITGSKYAVQGTIPLTFFSLFWFAVGLFGVGYLFVSFDLEKNLGFVWTGCFGKVVLFITFCCLLMKGDVTIFAFLLGLGDLAWAIFFIPVLRKKVDISI